MSYKNQYNVSTRPVEVEVILPKKFADIARALRGPEGPPEGMPYPERLYIEGEWSNLPKSEEKGRRDWKWSARVYTPDLVKL